MVLVLEGVVGSAMVEIVTEASDDQRQRLHVRHTSPGTPGTPHRYTSRYTRYNSQHTSPAHLTGTPQCVPAPRPTHLTAHLTAHLTVHLSVSQLHVRHTSPAHLTGTPQCVAAPRPTDTRACRTSDKRHTHRFILGKAELSQDDQLRRRSRQTAAAWWT